MNRFSSKRIFIPVTLAFMLFLMASCASSKKYGCPNHIGWAAGITIR